MWNFEWSFIGNIFFLSHLVEVMTFVSWKLSSFPKSRVIGVGANLDSERFQYILTNLLKAEVLAKDAWVIGEQGEDKGKVVLCDDYEHIMSCQCLNN